MSISGVNGIGATAYAYMNSSMKTTGEGNFASEVQKAGESQNTTATASAWAGDMVIPYPPNYSGFTYDSSISNKSKEEMTMDEYKQWVMNEMSQMPVSAWVRSTYSSGATVIKEEAFERMKSDPEYENYVLNRVRSAYSVSSLPAGSNNVSYDVIGASPEECYGYAGPVGNSSSNISGNEKSWWEKRHEKMEELLAEQEKEALLKYGAENTLKKMIEVLDNFERGLKALETVEDCDKVKECYNLAYKNFTDVLTKAGLEAIKAEGEAFDPNFHEAVMQTPTSEKPEHTIIAELQKGYKLGDKVLRPALVNVAVSEG